MPQTEIAPFGAAPEQKPLTDPLYQQFEQLMAGLNPADADPRYGCWELSLDSDVAQQAINLIRQAPAINPPDSEGAPFKNYANNTDASWHYVPEDIVRNFMNAKRFERTHMIGARTTEEKNHLSLDIVTQKGQTMPFPTGLIVSAQGFGSWQGRGWRGQSGKRPQSKFDMPVSSSSHNTIKHYAALPTELPPVDELRVFVQPDGTVFADNGAGDSHRIAAAILRGQQDIQAKRLSINLLDDNYITRA
ncbi:MAG TPA: hypothetical protein VHB72_00805 [Candidatus Saccharimonadales bacterium]|nr:hypothetical protein [Candidatus Saccharimonadales bacterium]